MNRRGFLTALGVLAAGLVLDEATGLLVPRKRFWQVGAKLEGQPIPRNSNGDAFYAVDLETRVGDRTCIQVFDHNGQLVEQLWPDQILKDYSPLDAEFTYYSESSRGWCSPKPNAESFPQLRQVFFQGVSQIWCKDRVKI